jgi:hypothetical protein
MVNLLAGLVAHTKGVGADRRETLYAMGGCRRRRAKSPPPNDNPPASIADREKPAGELGWSGDWGNQPA